jgi:hypothetical protein
LSAVGNIVNWQQATSLVATLTLLRKSNSLGPLSPPLGNITGGNLSTGGQVISHWNITGGNVTTVGGANVNALTTVTRRQCSVSGNITGGNFNSGNVGVGQCGWQHGTAGNIRIPWDSSSAAGNVTAPNFIGNVVGNISGNLSAPGANTQVSFQRLGHSQCHCQFDL